MDHIAIGPEGDGDPSAGRPEPELFAPHGEVARGRHDPVELHGPASISHRNWWGVGVLADRLDCLHRLD